jgi:hypothetical protein
VGSIGVRCVTIALTLPRRKGVGRQLLDSAKARETSEWAGLSTKDKVSKWVARHQYQVIVGGWAASMAVAGTIIMRDRYGLHPIWLGHLLTFVL